MNKIFKIIISIILFFVIIILLELFTDLGIIKNYLKYERNHVEVIDTTFLTEEIKNKIINSCNLLSKFNVKQIDIIDNKIVYHDKNDIQQILHYSELGDTEKNLLQSGVNNLIINYNNDGSIDDIYIGFNNIHYTYIYSINNHNYKEGYLLPGLSFRVEKVIDNHWYIIRICDRVICSEPQG